MLLHANVKALLIDGHTLLATNQLSEVERETECVEECECLFAGYLRLACGFCVVYHTLKQTDSVLQCAQERRLLFLYYLHDKLLLCWQLRESVAHLLYQYWYELIDERLLLVKEGIAVAHCTAQYATDNVSGLCVGWQLTVGNSKCYGTYMVNNNAQRNVFLLIITILTTSHTSHSLDEWLEHVGVIV